VEAEKEYEKSESRRPSLEKTPDIEVGCSES
jgi:hypothetical protein